MKKFIIALTVLFGAIPALNANTYTIINHFGSNVDLTFSGTIPDHEMAQFVIADTQTQTFDVDDNLTQLTAASGGSIGFAQLINENTYELLPDPSNINQATNTPNIAINNITPVPEVPEIDE